MKLLVDYDASRDRRRLYINLSETDLKQLQNGNVLGFWDRFSHVTGSLSYRDDPKEIELYIRRRDDDRDIREREKLGEHP